MTRAHDGSRLPTEPIPRTGIGGTRADDSTDRLAACHEALVSGKETTAADPIAARQCLLALEELRRDLAIQASHRASNQASYHGDARSTFGRFQLLDRLGQGGQGIVFKAWDPLLEREVALKVPLPGLLSDSNARRRFVQGARTLAALNHPNVMPVYEAGEIAPGCYIVSQYCAGPTLAGWLAEQSDLPEFRVSAELVAALADAVDYVHRQGILHRDIKPANVLLDPTAANRSSWAFTPKLCDFGLALLLISDQVRTRTGAVLGTPAYMAPEQAEGRIHDVGPATDVYALGVVLYELLTGRTPFQGESDLDTLRRISREQPVPPRKLRAKVPRDLDAICMKCLDERPPARYESAKSLAEDLRRFLDGRPVRARGATAVGRLIKWSRRRPQLATLVISLVLVAHAGVIGIVWQWRRAEAHRQYAEANFRQAHHTVRSIHNLLYESDDYDRPEFQPLRRTILQAALDYYDSFVQQQRYAPVLKADIADASYQLGFHFQSARANQQSLKYYQQALALWQELAAAHPQTDEYRRFLAKTHIQIGILQQNEDRLGDALRSHHSAQAIYGDLTRDLPDDPEYRHGLAQSHYQQGAVHYAAKRYEAALASLKRAFDIRNTLAQRNPDHRDHQLALAEAYNKIGQTLGRLGRLERAVEWCDQARRIHERFSALSTERPGKADDLAAIYHCLARLHEQAGRPDQAAAFYGRANDIYETLVTEFPSISRYESALAENGSRLAELHRNAPRTERGSGL